MNRKGGGRKGDQRGRQQQKRGGGTGRVFISLPASGDLVKAGSKPGTVDITISLQQAYNNPQWGVPTKVFIQGEFVGHYNIKIPADKTFQGIKIQAGKPLSIRTEKAGYPAETDTFEIPADKIKSAIKGTFATRDESKPWRLKVIVAPLTPKKVNPVFFLVKDENGRPCAGTVNYVPGQRNRINGHSENPTQWIDSQIGAEGTRQVDIQLLECDASITFIHVESGESVTVSLLKEA